MATYEICGTCSLRVENNNIHIRLIPAAGYISPDNKNAVFYPLNYPPDEPRLLPLQENGSTKYIERSINTQHINSIAVLNSSAGSSKKIQLLLDDILEFTGCVYPVA